MFSYIQKAYDRTYLWDPYKNKIMRGESYTDKIYRSLIKKMNAKTTNDSRT